MWELKLKLFVFGLWSFLNNFFFSINGKIIRINDFRMDFTTDWKIAMHWGGSLFVFFCVRMTITCHSDNNYHVLWSAWSLEWICVSLAIILVQHLFFFIFKSDFASNTCDYYNSKGNSFFFSFFCHGFL